MLPMEYGEYSYPIVEEYVTVLQTPVTTWCFGVVTTRVATPHPDRRVSVPQYEAKFT